MARSIRVVAFDLDETLTVSKSQIERSMAELLVGLLDHVDVCIISGGRFEQFEKQVLRHLPATEEQKQRLHIMPVCGTRYYRWQDAEWQPIYVDSLGEEDKQRIVRALTRGAQDLGLWEEETWGEIIEDRGSQITFSALGQSAPPEAKYRWDPDGAKRRELCRYAGAELPDFEVRSGGSTSVDVTRQGIDKAYGMGRLMQALELDKDELLFVGDRLDEGGNDYPVRQLGVACIAVTGWQETAELVARFNADRSLLDNWPRTGPLTVTGP